MGDIMTEQQQELRAILRSRRIPDSFPIEEEAEEMLLFALKEEGINNVYIDDEGGIIIDYNPNE